MTTKNNQHRGSFENLALSGSGDEIIIAKIDKLVHNHQIGQPYSRNVLLRIKDLIQDHLAKEKLRQGLRGKMSINKCDEAEAFAMELLMPHKEVYKWCLKLAEADIPSTEYLNWIPKLFGIPENKAHARLKELNIL